MTFIARKLRPTRWYQWLLVALVCIYLIYILLSYLYFPNKLKQVMETDIANRIGKHVSIERIAYNPFALSIQIHGFGIADQQKKFLIKWRRLLVNLGFWKSLLKWEIALDEFVIDQPVANIEKYKDRFNFSDIVERFNTKNEQGSASEKEPVDKPQLAIEITRLDVNQGQVQFEDFSNSKTARSQLDKITLKIQNLYLATGDKNLNPFELTAAIPQGGKIHMEGQYRLDPLLVDTEASVDSIRLSAFSDFAEKIIPIKVSNGSLSAYAKVTAKKENELQLLVESGWVRLIDLALDDDEVSPSLLRLKSINVQDVAMDYLKRDIIVGNVILDGITTDQWMDKEGHFRFERLIGQNGSNEEPADKKTVPSWNILVKKFGLKNSTLNFSDQNDLITTGHALSEIDLELDNVALKPGGETAIRFGAVLDGQGKIGINGTTTLSPLSANLLCRIEEIPLPRFSEYLETLSFIKIEQGSFALNGNVSFKSGDSPDLTTGLNMAVSGFQAKDVRTGKPLGKLDAFKLDDIQVDTKNRKVSIGSTTLIKPEIWVERSKNRQINLKGLIKKRSPEPLAAEQKEQDESKEELAWTIELKRTELQDGNVLFSDSSIKPAFQTGLYDMDLKVGPIATGKKLTSPFSLTAKIDKYAPLSIKGVLAPLEKQPGFTFNAQLKGLDMPGFSPYSAEFIGYNLQSGKLSLALDYALQDRKLNGKNNIVAENLYLGEQVPSENAIKAPVALGLALLRDVRGVIDLNVGVSGSLDDPGFSLSGIVLKALVNIIVKAAAAPFKLLAALVGGSENFGEITFSSGLAELSQEGQSRLKKLVEALNKKPQLAVRIKGNASKKADKQVLQVIQLQRQVADSRKISLAELKAEAGETSWWVIPENRYVLASMNSELKLPGMLQRINKLKKTKADLQGEALEREIYRQIYEDVKNAQKIGPDQLHQLADQRALSIKQYLVDVLSFDHKKVSVKKTQTDELTDRIVKLEIEAR